MSNLEQLGGENHAKLIAAFSQQIDTEPWGDFAEAHLSKDWQLIGEVTPLKIKATNASGGVFVKKYSPRTEDYSHKAFTALRELAELSLPTPILSPLALHENTLVFKMGDVKGRERYRERYNSEQQQQIADILTRHGVESLSRFDKIDIVAVDGKDYAVDPYEDSVNTLFEYSETQRNKAQGS